MVTRLNQNFDVNVIWDMTAFNQQTGKVEVDLRCRRETDFNMFETNFHKHLEHFELLFNVHWLKDRLVTVT